MKKPTMIFAATAIAALSRVASATGIAPPVEIRSTGDPWTVELEFDRKDIAELNVSSVLKSGARVLERLDVPTSIEGIGRGSAARALVTLPAPQRELRHLADGVYVQKLVVDAVSSVDAHEIQTQHAFYFRVDGDRIERIDIREYSRIADPTVLRPDGSGRLVPVHLGDGTRESADADAPPTGLDRQVDSGDRFANGARSTREADAHASEAGQR